MPWLSFIDDETLKKEVKHLLDTAQKAKINAPKKFGKNVIDPFSALFEMSGFNLSHDGWVENEMIRQAQKTLQNQTGTFHQNILGSIKGWENLGTGAVVDLVSHEKQIIAEVKNKYNTISGGKLSELYTTLENQVMPKSSRYKSYTAYYVTIIPKKAERNDNPFVPSDKEKGAKCPENELIRQIDGSSFYSLVTGEENALKTLYDCLPEVVQSVLDYQYSASDKQELSNYFQRAFDLNK